MSKELDDVIVLYRDTLRRNLQIVGQILKDNPEKSKIEGPFAALLGQSQDFLVEKWVTGKKYLRTVSALRAIPDYPRNVMELSLTLDATVNILDDLLDETLTKESKAFYIVEIIRLMSNFVQMDLDKELRDKIDAYNHKLISIAILEQVFYSGMKAAANRDELFRNAKNVENVRSTDMDIFLEIPLHAMGRSEAEIEKFVKLGRIFRCLNLIKKDLDDYDHDVSMGIDTIYTILCKDRAKLGDAVNELVQSYIDELKEFERNNLTENLFGMIEKERLSIDEKLSAFVSPK